MDIFIENIPSNATREQLKIAIANIIHGPEYRVHSPTPMNLDITIFRKPRKNGTKCGVVTLPSVAVANQFLATHGPSSTQSIFVGLRLLFKRSNKPPRSNIVEEVRRMPYIDPRIVEEQELRSQELLSHQVKIACLQFGWECRDNVFSVEWEKSQADGVLGDMVYNDERREFRIYMDGTDRVHIAVIHIAQIASVGSNVDGTHPVICFSLRQPPTFESDSPRHTSEGLGQNLIEKLLGLNLFDIKPPKRRRHAFFHQSHASTAMYTSSAIRIVCKSRADLQTFRSLCGEAHVRLDNSVPSAEYRRLFSEEVQTQFTEWLKTLSWKIAFQLESIVRKLLADPTELLLCRGRIERMISDEGEPYMIAFLRYFATPLTAWFWYDEEEDEDRPFAGSVDELFAQCASSFVLPTKKALRPAAIDPDNLFDCLHVTISPTRMQLDGPYPERSNRVMRSYPHNHDSFLRVSFVEESKLQIRLDPEVDGRAFIKARFGNFLHEGLIIGGRKFNFLAYSQSALKEHAVWFVKDFITPEGVPVTAQSIIASLGDFTRPDPQLVYCPARYAARISQAFTATDSSTEVEAEEIFRDEDILDPTGRWNFTDGVGTISREMAIAVWKELRKKRRKARRSTTYPRAFQVRFQGSKGMLSVDHRLEGKVITLRPSMIKFEAPESTNIEIARAFDKPGPFYLNRPLIMILEQLGVPYETFEALQDRAVRDAQNAVRSLARGARLLEAYGLGASFKLTSVMLSLDKMGIDPPTDDVFYQRMMDFAVNHVLRELKHHARIPVKDAWNLVGVADIHGYLNEGEVFIHVVPTDGQQPFFFEGQTLITRSPTIHPGDVQVARAIGAPPPDSPFANETLRNCVVFSTKGSRPLPACLGGGDLDGDVYCATMLPELRPRTTYEPARYTPALKKLLDRPSTMHDVADFVTEYLYSDSLGLIAIQWLLIADQSTQGIFDNDCMLLSDLHSDAVDYPKNGNPVSLQRIPKLKMRAKPDWNAPETVTSLDPSKYYQSQRAIGRLFRAIDLPAVHVINDAEREQRRRLRRTGQNANPDLDEIINNFHAADPLEDDEVTVAVYERVMDFIAAGRHDDDLISELWELFQQYTSQLHSICTSHTLSNKRGAMLTEEEVIIGTIVAKCSQPRKRKDLMSTMRERTATLAQEVGLQIEGDEGTLPYKSLERAWVAYRIANLEDDRFGARSFGWVALGEVFDAIKKIEESEGYF
ncbi:hypothetical protein QCA50_001740 [Cerrena zonata]|uniref:RNA-dependent RNA polymerase n=1 Tax=Cerrena zonata TaxID=2478898 RepID=A0AAW0GXW1_9APHY